MARSLTDTIAAQATPPGEGGIAIVRLSGPDAASIAANLLKTKDGGPLELVPRRAALCHAVSSRAASIDEVLALYMPGPHSYTREDVVEIHTHGGAAAANTVLRETLRLGARLADPGEFTLRAFLRGRIDLVQAESVADIIKAGSESALRVHESLLEGALSSEVAGWQKTLIEVLSQVEPLLDFPEDDLAEPDFRALWKNLEALALSMRAKIATHAFGRMAREGFRIAIMGAPNVGKSRLFNRIIDEERAIVSPHEGTTRDTIDAHANICGVPVRLVDTAGIRQTSDVIETEGVQRARKAAAGSDLVIYVFDAAKIPSREELIEAGALFHMGRPCIVVANKCDLSPSGQSPVSKAFEHPVRFVSALTGEGIDQLLMDIRDNALGGSSGMPDGLLTRERHRLAVEEALASVEEAMSLLAIPGRLDAAAAELQRAMTALRTLLGWGVPDDVLDRVFAEFCIGK